MNLLNMTIKRKIAFGFGIMIFLLAIIGGVSFFGVGGIVKNAREVISGNKLDATLAQFEVDNLRWSRDINYYLSDKSSGDKKLETDSKNSSFGKWLDGESYSLKESIPEASAIINDLKKQNDDMYNLAEEITKVYKNSDNKLPARIVEMKVSLMEWASAIRDALIKRAETLNVETDHTKSALAIWMNSDEGRNLFLNGDGEFKKIWANIKDGNIKLHKTAVKINSDLIVAAEVGAYDFEQFTLPVLKETLKNLDMLKLWSEKALEGDRKASAIFARKIIPGSEEFQRTIEKLREVVKENTVTDKRMLGYAMQTRFLIIVLVAVALCVGLLAGYVIATSIIKVLKEIADEMKESSEKVATASQQIQTSSQQLADGAAEQTASLEESTSSLEEMAAMTQNNASNSSNANSLMKETTKIIGQTEVSMQDLIKSMDEILKTSTKTSEIIKTIDGIAFQTNLLALNASVEAARAGDAGAGFAVVADEVRNLALKSSEAAKDTTELVQGIVGQIQEGNAIVKKVNEVFSEVGKSASDANDLVSEISAATSEQSGGIEQVNKAMTEINRVTGESAANAEETASSSVEMNSLSENMKFAVDRLHKLIGAKEVFKLLNLGRNLGLKRISGRKTKKLNKLTVVGPDEVIDENLN